MITLERRHELMTEIRFRLNGTEEHRQLREALELDNQPINALEELYRRLVRWNIKGQEEA